MLKFISVLALFQFVCVISLAQCPPSGVTCDQIDPGTSINTNFDGEVICVMSNPGSDINLSVGHDDVKVYVCSDAIFNGFSTQDNFYLEASQPFGSVVIRSINVNDPNATLVSSGGKSLRVLGANLNNGPVNFISTNESTVDLGFSINTAHEVNLEVDTNSTAYINSNVTISNGNFNIRKGASLGVNGYFHGNGTNVRVVNYDSMYVDGEFYVQGTNAFQNACGESTLEVGGDFRLNSSSSLINEGTIRSNSLRVNSSAGPISMGNASNFITGSIDAMNTLNAFEFTGNAGECALVDFTSIVNWNFDLTADSEIQYCGPATGSKPGSATISCVCNATPIYCDPLLPVEFLYINAFKVLESNKVVWGTAEETNNSHFVVERSIDGHVFESIGSVQGSGNSSSVLSYSFIDSDFLTEATVYYRIKQVDFDGQYSYSKIVVVAQERDDYVSLVKNPIQAGTPIGLLFFSDGDYSISLIDVLGKVYYQESVSIEGNHLYNIPTDVALYTGVFHLRVSNGIESKVLKVLVQH